jgi:molybdopterin-guanine dinucleotide biosynthesis protein A
VAHADLVFTIACDLPFLTAELLDGLRALATGRDGAWVVGAAGPEPLIACYRRAVRSRVRDRIAAGRLKAQALGQALDLAAMTAEDLRAFGLPERLLANVNTAADYARVQYGPS